MSLVLGLSSWALSLDDCALAPSRACGSGLNWSAWCNLIYCIFRDVYDLINSCETQREIDREPPEHGNFSIWKRKHVTLVAILPPWQQPALSSGGCSRRQRWKETESPLTSVGVESNHLWNWLCLQLFQLCKATIPFDYLVTWSWVFCYMEPKASWVMQVRTMFIFFTAASPRPDTVRNAKQTKPRYVFEWKSELQLCVLVFLADWIITAHSEIVMVCWRTPLMSFSRLGYTSMCWVYTVSQALC